jgi:hypothetical protein
MTASQATFFTIGTSNYFPGVVALINSLRLLGHRDNVVVLDEGFTPCQQERLRSNCTLVSRPHDQMAHPTLLKPWPYLVQPSGTVIMIDSDIIVTRSLASIIALAQSGKLCAFPDPEPTRWFAEWETLFGLDGPPRHQVYVNAGFVAFSTQHWPDLLTWWWQACQRIKDHPFVFRGEGPTTNGDQDPLNALLMTKVPKEDLELLPEEEAPAGYPLWRGWIQVTNVKRLSCQYHGHQTTLLHSAGSPKPWIGRGWFRVRRNAYNRLLSRVLLGPDVAIPLKPDELPIWLRRGMAGELALRALHMANAPIMVRLRSRPFHLAARLLPPRYARGGG